MHTLIQDVRYAFRQLRSHFGFALTTIVPARKASSVDPMTALRCE